MNLNALGKTDVPMSVRGVIESGAQWEVGKC